MDFVLCPMRNFNCNDYMDPIEIKHDGLIFYVLKDYRVISNVLMSYKYINFSGMENIMQLENKFVIYVQSGESLEDISKRRAIINNFHNSCELISTALWFIRDNAITPYWTTISSTENIEPQILRRNVYYSNAVGEYDIVSFTKKELGEAMMWYGIIDKLLVKKEINSIDMPDGLLNTTKYIGENLTSFQRAYMYLVTARKTEFLPAKISSYISLLECICAVKGENTQKVSERIAYLIGNNVEDRIRIYDDIKSIYDFRSLYVHGSQITEKKHLVLPQVCKKADEIVRNVLSKIFIEHTDLNYMTKRDKGNSNSKNSDDVDRWFNELIFRKGLS
ncbi:HEPN domain-containing protein [Clostridium paraputrificum]|uniref:HEPN domain-containing protein n=1 Tax=Clostridium paraputrificum TaxID=29363 RepID=UPI000C0711CF|nr:HEPN domain-containing protein [Clostridium paraputrificum]